MTKDLVLNLLWQKPDGYLSGEEMAKQLAVSRAAVWKAVEQLRSEGYEIDSAPNRGYCLHSQGSGLNAHAIRHALRHRSLEIEVFKSISSTNTVLKQRAEEGAAEGLVLVAEEQTAGRGRMGRSFYSPAHSGIYMSILLRPAFAASEATSLTALAAVAAAEAIEACTGLNPRIKWVNDLYLDGKKVCGILTEGSLDCETGLLHYAVIGIGINLEPPQGGFPGELRETAGALYTESPAEDLRVRLTVQILDRLIDFYEGLPSKPFYEKYRARSFLPGQSVDVQMPCSDPIPATVLDIAPDFSLLVRYSDGSVHSLNSGEVSVRSPRQHS